MRAGEHDTTEIEALGTGVFDDLQAFCLFIGYPKSGHSLVGALLDAHPDVIIAKATNPLALVVADGLSREEVFALLVESSRSEALRGRKQNKYRYEVPGQWQGRVRTARVIGDKFSDRTTKRIRRSPGALQTFAAEVQLPLRLVHVVRNPFDMVARITLSKIRHGTPDEKIARAYDCYYDDDPPGQYMAFFSKTKAMAEALAPQVKVDAKTLLKLIDEYNYAKYTKGWI